MATELRLKLLMTALTGLIVAACSRPEARPEAVLAPAVEAVRVGIASPNGTVLATGRIERRREMDLSFRIPGVMTRMTVEAGDRVRAGQVLATLDPTGVVASEQRANADLERVRRDLARDQALFEKGFVSRARLDDRASAVKSAQAALNASAFDRRWATLVSPVSGVVLDRTRQSGEVVQPGQVILRVADERSPFVLRAPTPERDATRIQVGAAATIKLDNAGADTVGRVTRVGQSAGTRTGAVDIEIELPPIPGLRSGQIASARIEARVAVSTSGELIRLPAEAILEAQDRRATVFLVEPGTTIARRRSVTFSGFDGDDALVSGLPAGSQVITAGAGFVGDGEKVRVVDPARLSAPGASAK
jgi:membrane fusion protein, multidrug efflux system